MNWNPFKAITELESDTLKCITALESRIESLEWQLSMLNEQLSEDGKAKKALEVLRKARQRDYGRRYYEKRKAMKAAAQA